MAFGMGYGGGASTGFGTQGQPQFQRLSSTNDPTNKTMQIQSADALFFTFTINGVFAGQLCSPDGMGPYTALGSLMPNPYPTSTYVTVYDKSTGIFLGGQNIDLFGGDVYKVRITYREYVPIANGFVYVLLNGEQMIINGSEYYGLPYESNDVIPRGSY